MDALAALYPSATGGSGVTLSPLSAPAVAPAPVAPTTTEPAAAPAAGMQSSDRQFTELSDELDDDGLFYRPKQVTADADADLDGVEHDVPAEPAEAPFLEARPKIEAALRDARDTEPSATSVTDFANFARPVDGVEPIPEGLQAMVKLGLGVTQAQAVWKASVDAVRSPVQTNMAGAEQTLRAEYGEHFDTNLAAAKSVIAQVEKTYPGVRQWLSSTGLGNDPTFIRQVVDFAARRGNR